MKFTLSWLKEHLETDADVQTIADKLTSIGLEVESIEDAGARLKDFTVAEIVSAEKHPNADKLRLCMVDTGDKESLQIVCGAPNARAGIKVVLARPGTVIPASGEALKIGTIRGVESRGMMCSARELLLGEDHDGIIELTSEAVVGAPAAPALGLTDPVIDVAITPNRGDAASVYGIARDLAAAGLGTLHTRKIDPVAGKFPSPKKITLDFAPENKNACPIFAGRLIRNVKNGPSPQWVQDRLKSVGMKSISALVDATNLIAQDRGRPLHVFDADKLSGNLHARMASDHEQVLALDGKTYVLDSEMVVIADDSFARGIAGVMGGEDTGCSLETKNVFIESAWFDPVSGGAGGPQAGHHFRCALPLRARRRSAIGVAGAGALHAAHSRLVRRRAIGGGDRGRIAAAPQAHRFRSRAGGESGRHPDRHRRKHPHPVAAGFHRAGAGRHPACDAAQLPPRHRRARRSGGRNCPHPWPYRRAVGAAGPRPRRGETGSDRVPAPRPRRAPYPGRARFQRMRQLFFRGARARQHCSAAATMPASFPIPSRPIWMR